MMRRILRMAALGFAITVAIVALGHGLSWLIG
jgi:hypothetical protein